jgi:hypothetical protein
MIQEKYFIVLLAENNHGKGHILRSFVEQSGQKFGQKSHKTFSFPQGKIESYLFCRSFYEEEFNKHKTPFRALVHNIEKNRSSNWYEKDLIIMPSHSHVTQNKNSEAHVKSMLETAQQFGYNTILAYIIKDQNLDFSIPSFQNILSYPWGKRWQLNNPDSTKESVWKQQCKDLGKQLYQKVEKLFQ